MAVESCSHASAVSIRVIRAKSFQEDVDSSIRTYKIAYPELLFHENECDISACISTVRS